MSLKDTFKQLRSILQEVTSDLEKSEQGNKAASQRVRTGTIKLEKVAKLFRKESVKAEKTGSFKKPKSKGGSKTSEKAAASSSKPSKNKAPTKSSKNVAKSSGKGAGKNEGSQQKMSTSKKPTAKIKKKK